eukprot:GHVH01010843.1.p1 GENE.GHVH01010843.1~~GHVH01010843.1.p1  ORF type:complete len:463 (-),score=56.09 GHVH01010843.1:83-1471(-)
MSVSPYYNSAWPKVHQSAQNLQSSLLSGIQPNSDVRVQTMFDDRLKFTLGVYTDSTGALWGSSNSHVFKVAEVDGKYEVVDAIQKPFSLVMEDVFHGIYSFVDKTDTFYTYSSNEIYSFGNIEVAGDASSSIEMKNKLTVKSDDEDRIMSLGKDFNSDSLLFATEHGRFAAANMETGELIAYTQLNGDVSNAMAQLDDGSIIVLTDQGINKIKFENNSFTTLWSQPYSTTDDFVARPSGGGSGTSPTIMTLDDGRQYIVIADGMTNQNVLVFDVESGDLVGSAPSIALKGDRFVVVQNSYSWIAERVSQLLDVWNVPEKAADIPFLSSRIRENTLLAPVLMGDANLGGFLQFKFDPDVEFEDRVKVTWESDRSCPNAIPVIDGSGGLYCIGKIDSHFTKNPANGFGGVWAVERQNWFTGEHDESWSLGLNINFNSSYSASQIIGDGKMVYGSFGGLVFISSV